MDYFQQFTYDPFTEFYTTVWLALIFSRISSLSSCLCPTLIVFPPLCVSGETDAIIVTNSLSLSLSLSSSKREHATATLDPITCFTHDSGGVLFPLNPF